MTKEEMLEAIHRECDKYPLCECGCPLMDNGELCRDIEDEDCTEGLVKLAYVTMFPPGEAKVNDSVSHPSHYNQGDIECIDAMIAAFGKEVVAYFCICNAFKYVWRSEHKNGKEDIDKTIWYLNKYVELKSNG